MVLFKPLAGPKGRAARAMAPFAYSLNPSWRWLAFGSAFGLILPRHESQVCQCFPYSAIINEATKWLQALISLLCPPWRADKCENRCSLNAREECLPSASVEGGILPAWLSAVMGSPLAPAEAGIWNAGGAGWGGESDLGNKEGLSASPSQVSCFRGPVSSESPGGGAARRATWHVKGKNEGDGGRPACHPGSAPIRRKNNFTWLGVPQGQDSRGSREWKSKRRPHNGSSPSAGLFTSK